VEQEVKIDPLKVTSLTLDNGLKVFLNVDPDLSNVFGAVIVKGGAKRDPEGHPGIAHYFEHIMFKGTDKIGTTNYQKEKVYLDSIVGMYDKLGETSEEDARKKIQDKINKLSLEAGKFAIPNEMDKLLEGMGGTGVNAFTSKDVIAYHNSFPGNQLEKWLEIYSHRFVNPVYRLFQSELEVVYEEKNMSRDNPIMALIETFEARLYKGHPYGKTVLGDIENLKNPSLTKMDKYFQTYYVANNMALMLTGNFNIEEAIPMIKEKFGKWRTGNIPEFPEYDIEKLEGRVAITKRLTPIRIGLLGFPSIGNGHPDEIAMTVCNKLLSNASSTGLLDKLTNENELLYAGAQQMSYIKAGSNLVIFVPKLVGQPFDKAEKLVLKEIDKLKSGEFDDELFDAIKTELDVQFQKGLENARGRFYMLMNAFLEGKTWEEVLAQANQIKNITKEDVLKVANKYYGDNFLSLQSKMGFPKKEKLTKPGYKAVEPENIEAESDFAKQIKDMEVKYEKPHYIEFNKDVYIKDLSDLLHYYYTPNPVNDLFSMRLKFGVGYEKIPLLKYVSGHLSLLGTEKNELDTFNRKMQKLGSSYHSYASDDYFFVNISGLEKNIDKTMALMQEFLSSVKPDDSKIKKMVQNLKMDQKFEKKDPSTEGRALKEYVLYGDKSDYLDRLPVKEVKKLKSAQLVDVFHEAQKYELEFHYSGKIPSPEIEKMLTDKLLAEMPEIKTESPLHKEKNRIEENVVYLVNDKKALQSQIYLMIEGAVNDKEERVMAGAFNKYFSRDMSSIVFQEVREFRSLAYSAYAYHSTPFHKDKKGYTFGFLSSQADKTVEAVEVMHGLMADMPKKEDRIDHIKTALIQSINSQRPTFRYLSNSISYWRKKGYKYDPRKDWVELYDNMVFDDIVKFYDKNMAGRPIAITIVGDLKRIETKDLEKFGRIVKLKKKDLFRK
ncbi:MAG: insulinase family protein, partial [Bacteroidota bacterium]|nr:insulinase family protein [Bacteroidota bacterium]